MHCNYYKTIKMLLILKTVLRKIWLVWNFTWFHLAAFVGANIRPQLLQLHIPEKWSLKIFKCTPSVRSLFVNSMHSCKFN